MATIDRLQAEKVDRLHKNKGVERLSKNVWLVKFQENPEPLARLVSAATQLDFGRFMLRRRARFQRAAKYGAEFLYCLGLAGTCEKFDGTKFRGVLPRWHR